MSWQKYFILHEYISSASDEQTVLYIYVYVHTHIYRTFLSKKEDHKDNKQTYYRAKDPRSFLHRLGQNYARGQWSGEETVRTPYAS